MGTENVVISGSVDATVLTEKTMNVLSLAASASENPSITVTSTIRTPERQAEAMYANLASGNRIRYKAPGMAVTAVYDECVKAGKSKADTVSAMVKEIEAQSEKGQRVSLHCVSREEYAKLNIVDVSRHMPNPRDFVRALMTIKAVTKVITPIQAVYGDDRVSVDTSEGAIHVEIQQ